MLQKTLATEGLNQVLGSTNFKLVLTVFVRTNSYKLLGELNVFANKNKCYEMVTLS